MRSPVVSVRSSPWVAPPPFRAISPPRRVTLTAIVLDPARARKPETAVRRPGLGPGPGAGRDPERRTRRRDDGRAADDPPRATRGRSGPSLIPPPGRWDRTG